MLDPADPTTDGVRQTFTNKEQEGRVEVQLLPFNLRFATLTTALGVQAGHQELTAPSPDNAGLWDPNNNHRIAGYMFNEFKFSESTKAQVAGRIESVRIGDAPCSDLGRGVLSRDRFTGSSKPIASAPTSREGPSHRCAKSFGRATFLVRLPPFPKKLKKQLG